MAETLFWTPLLVGKLGPCSAGRPRMRGQDLGVFSWQGWGTPRPSRPRYTHLWAVSLCTPWTMRRF
ncbi:SGCA isoform 12 [Pan troglodytes]|uniref:Sarcoglycan alpha n=2 Tax=Homininae TaxID=207598 RepID=D6R9S3_HUMAN|nr:sarcoglycan alpha [Homo sapiens]KAI4050426.1 sarcoglycan alpha [Homo sapiens]PNI58508.1 SGCA isoform 12 [Pan troglodytes]